ncbi:MAG: hypothetical protein M1834_006374 [Cirrosporium novae-zelandiae]|nr:MAG: hypothetical protein M1834_006374 [Cirrosporium novae-zelandiae]
MVSNRFSLEGRTALVTGGARGCGLAFAEGLAEAGADVAIFDIIPPSDEFHTISKKYKVRTGHFLVDVSNEESLKKGYQEFSEAFGDKLDICVPCAGINKHVPFLEYKFEDLHHLLSVNVVGAFMTAQLAAKQMIRNETKKGSIVMVASIASYMAIRTQMSSGYCSTKGGVRAMVSAIAKELVPYGIRINSVSPGYVQTAMTECFPDLLEGWKDEIMNGRVAMPDDIMGACVFLASDASSYMTGHDIPVDGGVLKW